MREYEMEVLEKYELEVNSTGGSEVHFIVIQKKGRCF